MTFEETGKYLKLIADPNRLIIIRLLTKKLHMYANEFLKEVTCKQATLSHHLNEMTQAGLLNAKKKGNKVSYSINATKYEQLINSLDKLERTGNKVEKEQKVEVKVEEKPIRVVDAKLINKDEHKVANVTLPIHLL